MMWIFPVIFIVVMLIFVFRGTSVLMGGGREMRDREDSAHEILGRRYARGEIGQDEYQRMKKDLDR